MIILSNILTGLGCLLMIWGTLYIMKSLPLIVKLHTLGVSDTLGAMLVVAGLMVRFPARILPLGIAFMALLFWGPLVTYLLAKGASRETGWRG